MIDTLCIVGTGLIGGSLARDLKRLGEVGEVVGSSRRASNLQRAADLGVIDRFDVNASRAVAGADMVVVAVPLGAVPAVLEQIRDAVREDAIVTDVGSAKGSVVTAARAALGSRLARFVPAHPVAGTEYSGCRRVGRAALRAAASHHDPDCRDRPGCPHPRCGDVADGRVGGDRDGRRAPRPDPRRHEPPAAHARVHAGRHDRRHEGAYRDLSLRGGGAPRLHANRIERSADVARHLPCKP